MIKEYFANYFLHMSDVTFDMAKNQMEVHERKRRAVARDASGYRRGHDDGRTLKRVAHYLHDEPSALPTAMAWPTSISLPNRVSPVAGKQATVTAVQPRAAMVRFGLRMRMSLGSRRSPTATEAASMVGFCAVAPILSLIDGDDTRGSEPMEQLAATGQLMAYPHDGFWQPMDTLREKNQLEALWQSRQAPWKVWP